MAWIFINKESKQSLGLGCKLVTVLLVKVCLYMLFRLDFITMIKMFLSPSGAGRASHRDL